MCTFTTSEYERGDELKECLYGNPSLPKTFCHKSVGMIPPPTGTLWLCGTSVYSILPSQFNGRCTLVYVLPAIRENHTLHLKFSTSTKFSFYQQRWLHSRIHLCTNVVVKNSWCINPIVWCHAALDQVRSLSESVQKLANDTVLGPGHIKDTLASHKMMILQNRVALDYILATQRGACTIIVSGMLHRVNGSNRELEQNPTRHSWSFRKITPDD